MAKMCPKFEKWHWRYHTPRLREIVFNTIRYRRSETAQRSRDFHSKQCQLCTDPTNVSRANNILEKENVCKL